MRSSHVVLSYTQESQLMWQMMIKGCGSMSVEHEKSMSADRPQHAGGCRIENHHICTK